jgi:hypothetical protein
MTKAKDAITLSEEEATKLLQEAAQKKGELCAIEIYNALKKYEFGMIPEMLFRGTKLETRVLLVSRSGFAVPLQPPKQMKQPFDEE